MTETATQKHVQLISANDLMEGDVVYLTPRFGWTRQLSSALVCQDDIEAASALGHAESQQDRVIGCYLIQATLDDNDLPVPVHFREQFRHYGPTHRLDLQRSVG